MKVLYTIFETNLAGYRHAFFGLQGMRHNCLFIDVTTTGQFESGNINVIQLVL